MNIESHNPKIMAFVCEIFLVIKFKKLYNEK